MSWVVFYTSQLESNLTSYERVKEYCNTPREVKKIVTKHTFSELDFFLINIIKKA